MEKITEFLKKNWIWIAIAIIVIIVALYLKNKKESGYEGWAADLNDSGFDPKWREAPCADCGPGGMFGPAYAEAVEKAGGIDKWFGKRTDELIKRARELSGGISDKDFELAIKRSGGFIPYIQGRERAINRIENATSELKDLMKFPGVHGMGTIGEEYIEIKVLDEATKKAVMQEIEERNKKNPVISCRPLPFHYMGYPVKIVIGPMAKAL
jgi:hypothetical protein